MNKRNLYQATPTSDLEVKLQTITDWLYANLSEQDALHLEIGIWDWDSLPYSFYAVLKDSQGSAQYGESSYDSLTVQDAIECIINELYP